MPVDRYVVKSLNSLQKGVAAVEADEEELEEKVEASCGSVLIPPNVAYIS
jgi:hypothetical protein